ncbi:MAG TPA: hypothetical protein VKM00_06255, partial [Luteimonas sp.]|nr:hypothetical protein [Luteimonas sp.]
DVQFERGDISQSMATTRSLLALEQDPRRPSSLGPILWREWIPLAITQAQLGDASGAARSLQGYAKDAREFAAQAAPGNPRRRLMAAPEQILAGRVQLAAGENQAAYDTASAVIARTDAVQLPADDQSSVTLQNNLLYGALSTAANGALRMGHLAQAEALARRWLALPPNPRSEDDPLLRTSSARATLANAIALQGRTDEARTMLQPALAYYAREQEAGAKGTTFRGDYAYALYVSSLTEAADPAKRRSALDQASALVAGASTEAQSLADMRELTRLIASGRSAKAIGTVAAASN